MVRKSVAIIDYGVGNLLSVTRALRACDADVRIVKTAEEIMNADRIVLPGVGAFGNCINELINRQLESPILEFIKTGKPLLGICVGMQILQERGEEFGIHRGLGIIPGKVVKIPTNDQNGFRKVPFVGWAKLSIKPNPFPKILTDLSEESFFYFVHSFKVETDNPIHTIAQHNYCNLDITSLVNKDNVFGCQFHPEKSGEAGIKFLNNFITVL